MTIVAGLKRRFQRLRERGERGSILILVVLSSLIIIGSAGLAVDVGRLYATKAELSRAVDAAALSGVLEFNGTAGGLINASTKACSYLQANEPTVSCSGISPNGGTSTLTIHASKTVRLYFLPIFGLNSSSVSARAVSGFNNATVDAVMVIDSTASMSGNPLDQAKAAAKNFKDTLLGASPSDNVRVGVAPLRGCYRPTPMPAGSSDCIDNATQVVQLTSNTGNLTTKINALTAGSPSATNICTGLGKGYEILNNATYNHQGQPNNRRYLVLLSDGDNYYRGDYTYQASPASPNTFNIAGTNYACMPPSTCTGWGTPCGAGTYPGSSVDLATDGFETNNLTGGTGWAGNWTGTSGSPAVVNNSTTPAQAGSYSLRLRQTDTIHRVVNLSGINASTLKYHWKRNSWESGDNVLVQCATSTGGSWATLRDLSSIGSGMSSWVQDTVSLPSGCRNSATVYIRFQGSMSATDDQFYLDQVVVTNDELDPTGYQDQSDGQNPSSCNEAPKPRERQLDIQTLNLAKAIRAQNIEIFVVAFSACSDGDGATIYNAAGNVSCNAQTNPVSTAPASGRVGDTMLEDHANARLAKCIASSTPGTNDHYWYSNNASQLPNIFTTIAAQIAHRLVE